MTKEEKFRFDLQGFLVVKNVLSADEVDALNKLADEVWPAPAGQSEDDGNRRTSRVSMWGPETQALFDHPNALPYMIELLGPTFRVDHDYSIFMKKAQDAGDCTVGQHCRGVCRAIIGTNTAMA